MESAVAFKTATNELKRPVARNRILSARFTDSEYSALESLAWSKGMTLADWSREVLTQNTMIENAAEMEMHIFTELVGLQMLLMNTLEPLLRGSTLNQERINAIFRQVQTTQAAKAQELLAKRSQK
jgi:hypothetical protein